ncbi:Na+/proline symporter [Opitutaceae bacterium TAV1]|nr:Na+/proline symporter [Opitutaceae bacterium TAV1]
MTLTAVDWIIIAAYFAICLGIGLVFRKRAGKNLEEYFVSGRQLPWWLAAGSMVATTFAADTPLLVTALVAKNGVSGNWLWWSLVPGGMVTVFFFARLWRRVEVLTDIELMEIRYGGRPGTFLRVFRAVYVVCIVISLSKGAVTNAVLKVLKETIFHPAAAGGGLAAAIPPWLMESYLFDLGIIVLLLGVVCVYSAAAGLWGVVWTDVFQFTLAMLASIALAVVGVHAVGGLEQLQVRLAEIPGGSQALAVFPGWQAPDAWMPFHLFLIMLCAQWWTSSYIDPAGSGHYVQRMSSVKNEKDSLLAMFWFNIAHYCLRPWPWIVVALVSLVTFPEVREWALLPAGAEGRHDPSLGFPMVARVFAPAGLRGLIVVMFIAAFMSTISTNLNFGASYLINDVYRRFINPAASQPQLRRASRLATVLMMLLVLGATFLLRASDMDDIMKIMASIGAGVGTVSMLRWFWWRINAWSEISAMAGSLFAFVLTRILVHRPGWEWLATFQYSMLFIAAITIAIWLTVTLLTRPESPDTLRAFYLRAKPGGIGWAPVVRRFGLDAQPADFGRSLLSVVLGSVLVLSLIPAVGYLLFRQWLGLAFCVVVAAGCAGGIATLVKTARTRP